ncbi:ArsR/SmtB family transcription factor [Acholeplasma granularum]|uniref:ArsR/SmtB family transcription factor n=1 Tax=Acholeplasma granularum TaxID=264635 RepID=UPI00047242FE|nr:metalloregulator ArsR/SmtB family transcription factor [Acholeplasma granularum]
MDLSYADFVPMIKAISDETRLKILDMLSCGQMCACDLLEFVHISQSTLSYHMKILTDAQLVVAKKEGSWVKYALNQDSHKKLIIFFLKLTQDKDDCVCKDLNSNLKSLLSADNKQN